MSKLAAVFDSHPPEVYGSVTESQRGGLSAQKEVIAESPGSNYMPLGSDREGSNEYDIIPGEESRVTHSYTPHGDKGEKEIPNRGHVGGGLGSSFRGGEKKLMENSMYEDHELKKELVHPSLTSRGGQRNQVEQGTLGSDCESSACQVYPWLCSAAEETVFQEMRTP